MLGPKDGLRVPCSCQGAHLGESPEYYWSPQDQNNKRKEEIPLFYTEYGRVRLRQG